MSRQLNSRAHAALALKQVLVDYRSLDTALADQSKHLLTEDIPIYKASCFGVMRFYFSLSGCIDKLMKKRLRSKDKDIYALLLVGAYQIQYMRSPDYAVIDSCVEACKQLGKDWACGLVNAVLRRFIEEYPERFSQLNKAAQTDHPDWLYKRITRAWKPYAADILKQNNIEPPLCLRINRQRANRNEYLQQLLDLGLTAQAGKLSEDAIYLEDKPSDIRELPGFEEGQFSVQDEAPQLAASLIELAPGQNVLDACAAPGGKTCHMLEFEPELASMLAVDADEQRLTRVEENLQRLQLQATLQCAEIQDLDSWWDGKPFDRILCDLPCSATGVIRRHPDIKYLRTLEDIGQLRELQLEILNKLWTTLNPGGILLYATCSILPEENSNLIKAFCQAEESCEEIEITQNYGIVSEYGRQLFPQANANDGFYYAKLRKRDSR